MTDHKRGISRRAFLGRSGVAGGMMVLAVDVLTPYFPAIPASDRVRVAMVGLGKQGTMLLQTFMRVPSVEIAALCDVDELALRKASSLLLRKNGSVPKLSRDFRALLDDRSIDAVSIATPDHWHALMGIWALQAGKDCYIESPCSRSFQESKLLISATRKYNRVVQYGQPDQLTNISPVDLATIGRIKSVRTVCFINSPSQSTAKAQRFNDSRTYDLWLGPAQPSKDARQQGDWRNHPGMSNGPLAFYALDDLLASTRLFGARLPARVSSLAVSDAGSVTGGSTIAVQMEFQVAPGMQSQTLNLEIVPITALPQATRNLLADQTRSEKGNTLEQPVSQTTIVGTKGSLSFIQMRDSIPNAHDLVSNFVSAVRAGQPELLASRIDDGHRVATTLHLANASLQLQRPVIFDSGKERIDGDGEAARLLIGTHRSPYTLPRSV
jgi:hypothetical protein